jgi:serine/threonine protein kinase
VSDEEKISDMLLRWEEAQEQGEDLDAEFLCANCPEFIDDVRRQIASLRRMSWMSRPRTDDLDPKIGTTLAGRYRIDELIGEGGHGRVYRGFDPELQRAVAIKLPNDRKLNTNDLLEEARKVARLRHSGIVTVYDVGQHEGESFIVSDFVSGTTLCEAGPFSPNEATRLVAEFADSLHAAHEQGFVHRDIKPSNILIDHNGRPLLTDFGIAKVAGDFQAQIAGTLPYMAPEQLGDEPANGDPRTDIWSLGVVLYEILTGKLPFDDPSPAKLSEQIRNHVPLPPRGIRSDISTALEAVVLKCVAKAPEERYETAAELAHALRTIRQKPTILKGVMLSVAVFIPLMVFGASNNWFVDTHPATMSESPQIEGMYFDGQTRIVTPLSRFAPCTLEAWVRPEHDAHGAFIGSDVKGEFGLSLATHGGNLFAEQLSSTVDSDAHVTPGIWSHVAVVFDTEETILFLNGYEIGRGEPTEIFGDAPFVIGGLSFGSREFQFRGHMKWVRISEGSRYDNEFLPEEVLQPDDHTVLLYDLRNVSGNEVADLSSKGNHGQKEVSPVTAEWPALQRHCLHFEGGAIIETPVIHFIPSTLEAWVLPMNSEGVQHIIGSSSLSLMLHGFDLAPEDFSGIETGDPEVGSGRWTHVAGVFTDEGTYLFVNGRKVWNSSACKLNDASFLIGGVSTTNPTDQFRGQIRCVRISRGERFKNSFTPDHDFAADKSTVLIYEGKSVDGLCVTDVSGNENDSRWVMTSP